MTKLHFVERARKDNPVAKKGESYYWWAFMVGGRGGPKQYSKTRPRQSQLTRSEFLGNLYLISEDRDDLKSSPNLEADVADIASRLRELADETETKFDNLTENFQNGDLGQKLQSRIEHCNEAAETLEAIEFDDKLSDESADDYWGRKLEEVQNVNIDDSP